MKKSIVKEMLLKLREETLRSIGENMKMEIGHLQEAISDIYDLADDERERQFSILLRDRDREKLEQIDDALERLEEGTYGICEECGQKISEGRLKIRPFARYCVPCKSKIEKNDQYLHRQEEGIRYRSMIRDTDNGEE
ncbi:MAG: TraR/DksA family transcriptional regulator [Deltaproteobacteria bacterium]|nr:TraR/DksA family transcriptional regulator [Deltaproteobacteria bacterium]